MKPYLFFVLIISLVSCTNQTTKPSQEEIGSVDSFSTIDSVDFYVWPDSIEDILKLPDSVLIVGDSMLNPMDVYNPEQKALAIAIQEVMLKYQVLENDRFELKISREEFMKLGIPEPYYDQLLSSVKIMNHFQETTPQNSKSLSDDWEEFKKITQEVIDKYKD